MVSVYIYVKKKVFIVLPVLLLTALQLRALTVSQTWSHTFDTSVGNHTAGTNGRLIAVALWDTTIRVYRRSNGKLTPLQKLTGHRSKVLRIKMSSDSSHLLSVSGDYTKYDYRPRVWQLRNGKYKLLQVLPRHYQPVFGAAISADGTKLVTAGKLARFYRKVNGKYRRVLQRRASKKEGEFSGAAWDPAGNLAALRTARTIFLYDFTGNKPRLIQQLPGDRYTGKLGFSNDGRWLALIGKKLHLWKRSGKKYVKTAALTAPASWEKFRHAAFSPDSKLLWGASNGHYLHAWRLGSGKPVKIYSRMRRNYDIGHIVPLGTTHLLLLNYRTLKAWKIDLSGKQSGNSGHRTGPGNSGSDDADTSDDADDDGDDYRDDDGDDDNYSDGGDSYRDDYRGYD